ncbi:MAG: hypothetical protein KUG79_19630 [Pseudomonadales bacterium]|nr:hypothetical protein [Pseudomonadales bacterium]
MLLSNGIAALSSTISSAISQTDSTANEENIRTLQSQLQRQNMQLELAQNCAKLGFLHFSSANDVAPLVSFGARRILGITTKSEISEENFWAAIHQGDTEIVKRYITNATTKGTIQPPWQFRIIRPDHEIRYLTANLSITQHHNDHPWQIILTFQDISDAIRNEHRLRHAQKMEAVGALTGGISHDFNNLLQVILGNTELIQGELNDEDKECVMTIRQAAGRGSELTQRLLAFSRRQVLDPQSINVDDHIREILPLLRRTLGESIQITSTTKDKLHECRIDSGQLKTSILNLAINAQHSMPKGGTLCIETQNIYLDQDYVQQQYLRQQEEILEGNYIQLSVSDKGAGIPKQILDRVFEPFFTTREVGKGSGLGLSMVYGFIKQSGGHIEICSEVAIGTTVNLYLPVSQPNSPGLKDTQTNNISDMEQVIAE